MITKVLDLQINVSRGQKNLKQVDAEINKIDADIKNVGGDFQNVNNDAEQLNATVKKTGNASKTARKGFKTMGLALKAVGIGLLIKGLSMVTELFSTNQKVVDGFSTAVNMVTIAFNDFFHFIEDNLKTVEGFFKTLFEDPVEDIKRLGNLIVENLTNRIKAQIEMWGLLGSAIKQVFQGEFDAALETATLASKKFVDGLTGVNDTVEKLTSDETIEFFNDVGNAITEYTEETFKAAQANTDLANEAKKAEAINRGLIETFDLQAESLRQVRDDERLTIEERLQANEDLGEVLDKQEAAMKSNAQFALKLANQQLKMDKDNIDAQVAKQEALNELAAIEAQVAGFRSEQLTNQASLEKEQLEMNQTFLDGYNKRTIEQRKANDELIDDDVKRLQAQQITLDKEIALETQRLEAKTDLYAFGTQAWEDANEELLGFISNSNIQKKQLEKDLTTALAEETRKREELQQRNKQFALDNASQVLNTMSDLAQQTQDKFNRMNNDILDNEQLTDAQKRKMLAANNKRAKKAFDRQKAAQIAGALMTTYSSANSAYQSQFLPVPDPSSPIRGAVAAGAAIFAGLANVNKIRQQRFEATTLGGSSSGGGAGGGVGGGTQPPQFNIVGNSGVNQIANAVGSQGPVQAFVVAGAVTTQQQLNNAIVSRATL